MATRTTGREKIVLLVTTEILRPYKANEILGVPESIARKLLNVNMTDEFGQHYHTKVRLYTENDEHLQLINHTLNQEESEKLLRRLHPEQFDDDDVDPEDDYDEDEAIVPDSLEAPTEFAQVAQAQPKRGRGRPRGSTSKK